MLSLVLDICHRFYTQGSLMVGMLWLETAIVQESFLTCAPEQPVWQIKQVTNLEAKILITIYRGLILGILLQLLKNPFELKFELDRVWPELSFTAIFFMFYALH